MICVQLIFMKSLRLMAFVTSSQENVKSKSSEQCSCCIYKPVKNLRASINATKALLYLV